MRVTTQLDSLQLFGFVDLVGRAKLVVTNNLGVGDLLPPCLTKQMLGLDGFVTEEAGVGDHGHVVVSRHVVPSSQTDLGVVHRQSWSNDAAETVPVLEHCQDEVELALYGLEVYLGIIAVRPVKNELGEDEVVCCC